MIHIYETKKNNVLHFITSNELPDSLIWEKLNTFLNYVRYTCSNGKYKKNLAKRRSLKAVSFANWLFLVALLGKKRLLFAEWCRFHCLKYLLHFYSNSLSLRNKKNVPFFCQIDNGIGRGIRLFGR